MQSKNGRSKKSRRDILARRLAIAVMFLAGAEVARADMEIKACDAVVPSGAIAFLSADLDCPAGSGITLNQNASLRLNGFALRGNRAAAPADGVSCTDNCRVVGPGTVDGFSRDGVSAATGATLVNMTCRNNVRHGVSANMIAVESSTIGPNDDIGVFAGVSATIDGSTITGNSTGVLVLKTGAAVTNSTLSSNRCSGIFADITEVADSVITDNGCDGISGFRIKVERSTVSWNESSGIEAWGDGSGDHGLKAEVIDSTVEGNGSDGVSAFSYSPLTYLPFGVAVVQRSTIRGNGGVGVSGAVRALVSRSTIDGNGQAGAAATRVKIANSILTANGDGIVATDWQANRRLIRGMVTVRDSSVTGSVCRGVYAESGVVARGATITGNGSTPLDPPRVCADLMSGMKPRIVDTNCDTSLSLFNESWGVCSLDAM